MKKRNPILLSFYGLSNGKQSVVFGKIVYAPLKELSFINYSRLKTFQSIVALYRTRPVRDKEVVMQFDQGAVNARTDLSGAFWCELETGKKQHRLSGITLQPGNREVFLTPEAYPHEIQEVTAQTILISDLDDTLIKSFVGSKFKQLRTLLFTTVEKRSAVKETAEFIRAMYSAGAATFYLSNSEQNLYPMLYRFLVLNKFPPGPLMLRQYIHLRSWIWRKISRKPNKHKRAMLEKIVELFPDRKFVLLGDNTQRDLTIYFDLAKLHPELIRCVIIRQASLKRLNKKLLVEAADFFERNNIAFYYGTEFPKNVTLLTEG